MKMIVTKVHSILFYSVLIMPALSIQSSVAELKSMFPQYSEDFLVNIIQQERTLYHFTCDRQTDVLIMSYHFFLPMMKHPTRIRTS